MLLLVQVRYTRFVREEKNLLYKVHTITFHMMCSQNIYYCQLTYEIAFGIGCAAGSFVERVMADGDVDAAVPKFELPDMPDIFSGWNKKD